MTKFKGHFRVETTRLRNWDYSSPGWYFVTICTMDKIPYFGEILDGEMHLSQIGLIVDGEWARIENLRPNVSLDSWVIMPNHMHGILNIHDSKTGQRPVSTNDFSLKANSLGSIINQFKGTCTKLLRGTEDADFAWQPSYFDHIIRNNKALQKIRRYIEQNPLKWEMDEYYSQGS